MTAYLLIALAYLLGSISSAIIVCKAMGLEDPRTVGSNNPGATNVLRHGGKLAAGLTLLGDMLKGVIPVLIAHALALDIIWVTAVGFAAFVGHLYPVFFAFKGGKGVATALGVYLALNFWLGLAVALVWLIVAKVFKLSSLSALVATGLSPGFAYWLGFPLEAIVIIIVLTIMLWWRHRSNIQKLISGDEDRIASKEGSEG